MNIMRIFQELLISFEMQEFDSYLTFMEEHLSNESLVIKQQFEETILDKDQDEVQHIFEYFYEEEFTNITSSFPRMYRESLFLSIYAYLERKMKSFCDLDKDSKISLKDISHGGIYKYFFYLNNVTGLELNKEDPLFKMLQVYNKLRNRLAHTDSYLTEKEYKELSFIKGLKFSMIDKDRYEIENIDQSFNQKFLDVCSQYLHTINSAFKTEKSNTNKTPN